MCVCVLLRLIFNRLDLSALPFRFVVMSASLPGFFLEIAPEYLSRNTRLVIMVPVLYIL